MTNMPAATAILFDLDGTLADTAPDLTGTLHDMLAERGKKIPPAEELRRLASGGARALLCRGFELESIAHVPEILRQEYLRRYEQRQHLQSKLFDGIQTLLSQLERQRLLWGIVTSKPQKLAETLLTSLRLFPACLICPDQTTHTKPHPEPLLLALHTLSVEATQAVYIGDHANDLTAGREAGVRVIGCAWGYDLREEMARDRCDFWAESPAALAAWLIEAFATNSSGKT